jgi:hypothetical protein
MTDQERPAGLTPKQARRQGFSLLRGEFLLDKFVDFILIFVGLYAATALQRYQDVQKEKEEYVSLLHDFQRELASNLAQEKSIEKDLGPIDRTKPGENMGPMEAVFQAFFKELEKDEKVIHCLHVEFAAAIDSKHPHEPSEECHALYKKFDASHQSSEKHFDFKPTVLTPFYRYEVWELYLANGVRTFRNKELAVKIGEIYNNARLVERQVANIESTFNDSFMAQVGKSAATDLELAEIVHDEETEGGLSAQDQQILIQLSHAVKDEHFATIETQSILALKVERMKNTVLLMRQEIEAVSRALDAEIRRY